MADPKAPRPPFAPWDRRELPGSFTVEETARRVGHYKWIEMKLFEALGGWMVDTDLYLYSFKTGKIYSPLEERGQQGFPSISGNRLVWQDGVFGGDDIMEVRLPSGL